MDLLARLKKLFNRPGEDGARSKFNFRLLILLILGSSLLIFNSLFDGINNRAAPADLIADEHQDTAVIRDVSVQELAVLLEQIRGVSKVSVYAAMEDSGQKELIYDTEQTMRQTEEKDSGGGARDITEETLRSTHVILRDNQGRELPLVVRENLPVYRGVVVVANGVEDPAVKAKVVEALRSILGLPYHRISVLPRGE